MRNSRSIGLVIAFAVLATGVLAAWYLSRPGDAGDTIGGRLAAQSFATWDEFLSGHKAGVGERHQVVFIGIDGATWELLDPMIDEGILPTFAKLRAEGCWGVLRSVQSYVSPPAWTTMMTGYLPEKTGVYNFGHWIRDRRTFEPIHAGDVAVPSVWDVASVGGKNTAAVNVPVTYPAEPVNGIMVSGLLTPVALEDRRGVSLRFEKERDGQDVPGLPETFSPVMEATLDHRGNHFEFYLCDTQNDNVAAYNRVFLRLSPSSPDGPRGGQTTTAALFNLQQYSPWLRIAYVNGDESEAAWCRLGVLPTRDKDRYVIRFSHVLFSFSDTDLLFTYPESLADDMSQHFDYYFPSTYLDRELVQEVTRDAAKWASYFYDYDDWDLFMYVFTQSDNILHADGMSPLTKDVYRTIDRFLGEMLGKLPDSSTLIVASDHGFEEYEHSIDLNRVLERIGLLNYRAEQKIDYETSLVFHNIWCIYFNHGLLSRRELERRGVACEEGESPQVALKRYLDREVPAYLLRSHHADIPIEFTAVDPGAAGSPPDMIVKGTYDHYQIEMWNISKPRDEVITRLEGSARWFHNRDGIFVVYGEDVKRGVEAAPRDIQDITPTVLYRLGLPVAGDMDGRVMTDVFIPKASLPPLYVVEQYDDIPWESVVTDVERDSLEKRLRSLGYIR